MADDATAADAVAGRAEEGAQLHRVFSAELLELARGGPADRRDHGGDADRDRAEPSSRPSSRTASSTSASRSSTRWRWRPAWRWAGMRPVVALYSTFLQRAFDQTVHDVCQNDQPVAARGRPGRARRRGRDEPPGHVHAAGPAPAAEPRHRQPEGRAGAPLARCGPRSPRTTRSRSTTRATPGFGLPADRADGRSRSARARCCARDATSCSSGSGRSSPGRSRRPTRSRPRAGRSGSINARFAKPLDRQLILDQARGKRLVVTFEESVVTGGFG